jgi:RNA polymerase sigma factor (TIGR02999 family)
MTERPSRGPITDLLIDWRRGDEAALARLIPIVYQELRRVARAKLRAEPSDHTLDTTALVHETYLRLVDLERIALQNRTHFFAMAARLMREILVDHARRKRAQKRGAGATMLRIDDVVTGRDDRMIDILALDEALEALSAVDPRLTRVVELRFFAGLGIEETSTALGVSHATVERDWTVAKAWLYQHLSSPG